MDVLMCFSFVKNGDSAGIGEHQFGCLIAVTMIFGISPIGEYYSPFHTVDS